MVVSSRRCSSISWPSAFLSDIVAGGYRDLVAAAAFGRQDASSARLSKSAVSPRPGMPAATPMLTAGVITSSPMVRR